MVNVPTRTKISPIQTPRSIRPHETTVLTSFNPGKMAPLAVVPLLREDAVRRGTFRIAFEMKETVELLMNAVNVRVKAYLVPTLAFDRFQGMDDLNRSWEKQEQIDGGGTVIPYVDTETVDIAPNDILNVLGMHARVGTEINTAYVEAYNQIWNFRATNRSPDLTLRALDDKTLAEAFWVHNKFTHIVPDFDQALIDGEVPLSFGSDGGSIPVSGIGYREGAGTISPGPETLITAAGSDTGAQYGKSTDNNTINMLVDNEDFPAIYAELSQSGVTMSLANIDLAKRTAAFARLRTQYHGFTDDYIIDMLMDGIRIPEQELRQPILLAQSQTMFGMSKRYATDHGNMTESVVNGATFVDMSIRVPRINTGGVVMLVAEVTPEQLFERQRDPYLHANDVEDFPHYLRDSLDPEKVSVVPNEYVDIDHDTPHDTFGYAPLNYEWMRRSPNIGGKFYRPEVDASFDEDRQRIWAVETENPTLSQDFYLCTNMHLKPFVDSNEDVMEATVTGGAMIEGNTVFGQALIESTDDYDKIVAETPDDHIDKDQTDVALAAAGNTNALGTDTSNLSSHTKTALDETKPKS